MNLKAGARPAVGVEGDGGEFQSRKERISDTIRRGAMAKADSRLVSSVLDKNRSMSDTMQSRTFEVAIQMLLEKGRYDDLERLGDYYRDSDERLASGQRKSTIFYYALKTPRVPNEGRWLAQQLFEWKTRRPNSAHAQLACARLLMEVEEGRWHGNFDELKGSLREAMLNPLAASRQCLEKAAKLSPDSDVYALLIDQVRREGGGPDDAQAYLEKADVADSHNYHAEAQFARLLSERGRNWREAISSPLNAYFALAAYLPKVKVPPKEYVGYAQAAEKAFPKSALVKNKLANQAVKARDFELAAKKFAELGDRIEIYGWDDPEDFYKERNKLEDQGFKVRTGKTFPLPETPPETRDVAWQDDLLIRQAAELYSTQHFAELDAIAATFRAKTARSPGFERKVSRLYAGIEDEYWTKDVEAWERSVMAERWRKLAPNSTMAATLAGRAAISEAWDIRGGGYADTVSATQREGFQERLAVADAYLSAARAKPGPKDPELYQSSITVGMGQGADKAEMMEILKQARAADPLAVTPYQAMAQYLLPRWHGSQEELEEFLDSVPPEVFFSVAASCDEDIDLRSPAMKKRLLKSLHALALRHPTTETWSSVLFSAASIRDRALAAEAVSQLRGQWSPNSIPYPSYYDKLVAWSQGRGQLE